MILALLAAAYMLLPGDPLAADPNPTVGVANPAVTDANMAETICKPGWTATVRPSDEYTNKLKAEQLPEGADPKLREEDHVWPIEDGGHPTDPANLRPQFWEGPNGAKAKDFQVEDVVHRALCVTHTMTLEQGHAVLSAWILAHHPYPILREGAPR